MWKNVLFTMWFLDFVTVFKESYNCQNSHYLGRNRVFRPFLTFLCYNSLVQTYRLILLNKWLCQKTLHHFSFLIGSKNGSNSAELVEVLNLLFTELRPFWKFNSDWLLNKWLLKNIESFLLDITSYSR